MFQILFLIFTDFLFAYSPYYLIPVSALLRFQNLLAFFFFADHCCSYRGPLLHMILKMSGGINLAPD